MTKPVIVVTGGRKSDKDTAARIPFWAGCPADYMDAVLGSGGAPVLLPFLADPGSVRAILAKADGLLLTGGGDIDPCIYGEDRHPETNYICIERDAAELEAIKSAMDLGVPILGICRGIQILNVALGGTLIQHIPDQVEGSPNHAIDGCIPDTHTIKIEPRSLLYAVLAEELATVNSRHHQAVGRLGSGLAVSAVAEDGVIEAIESGDNILAVQFHPENIIHSHPVLKKLFDWLVERATLYAGK